MSSTSDDAERGPVMSEHRYQTSWKVTQLGGAAALAVCLGALSMSGFRSLARYNGAERTRALVLAVVAAAATLYALWNFARAFRRQGLVVRARTRGLEWDGVPDAGFAAWSDVKHVRHLRKQRNGRTLQEWLELSLADGTRREVSYELTDHAALFDTVRRAVKQRAG